MLVRAIQDMLLYTVPMMGMRNNNIIGVDLKKKVYLSANLPHRRGKIESEVREQPQIGE